MWDTIVSTLKGILALPADVSKGAAVAGTIWATLTDYRMWRSVGWLLLGLLLAVLGLLLWNRHALGSVAETAAVTAAA